MSYVLYSILEASPRHDLHTINIAAWSLAVVMSRKISMHFAHGGQTAQQLLRILPMHACYEFIALAIASHQRYSVVKTMV